MVLTNKKIYGLINEIAGERAVPIIEYLKNRKNVSEFIIADKVKMDMQTTRNILYTLNSYNVATYIRRKDRKKGWYISYWTFNRKRVKDLTNKLRKEKIVKLHERLKNWRILILKKGNNNFYIEKNEFYNQEYKK